MPDNKPNNQKKIIQSVIPQNRYDENDELLYKVTYRYINPNNLLRRFIKKTRIIPLSKLFDGQTPKENIEILHNKALLTIEGGESVLMCNDHAFKNLEKFSHFFIPKGFILRDYTFSLPSISNASGDPIIIFDHKSRENEGDIIFASTENPFRTTIKMSSLTILILPYILL